MPDYAATNNYPTPTITTTRRTPNSKTGIMRSTAVGPGEIIQVQGGHIIRATGRKDRHSKVYTAKGPRDRRVRLSAHTAIQFYDVQDRLGYDRPSKAVDWLITKAKDAIDKLDHLPPFDPTRNPLPLALEYPSSSNNHEPVGGGGGGGEGDEAEEDVGMGVVAGGGRDHSGSSHGYEIQQQQQQIQHHQMGGGNGLSLDDSHHHHHPSSMVADTMRSFFPTSTEQHGHQIGFHQSYDPTTHAGHHHHQDLGLSLHSFNDSGGDPAVATAHASLFEPTGGHGWGVDQNQQQQQQQSEMGRFSRLLAWSCGGGGGGGFGSNSAGSGLAGNSPAGTLLFGDRETLQSSFSQHQQQQQSNSIRAWDDLPPPHHDHHHHDNSPITGINGVSDFMAGFCIPTQIHHHHHPHHGINLAHQHNDNKASSMSTDSSH